MQEKNGTIGPIIGTLIVFIILIVAALYVWGQHLNAIKNRSANEVSTTTEKIIIRITSTSTDPTDIEHDLNGDTTVTAPGI